MRRASALGLVALGLLAAACAPVGRDFVRPAPASAGLGTTTPEDIRQSLGAPRQERSWARSEGPLAAEAGAPFGVARVSGTMRELYYYYENRSAEGTARGVQPSKSVRFWFYEERLVGYMSHSSFLADSTVFDEAKAATLTPWRSMKADVLAGLGTPAGVRIYPMVPRRGQEMLTYFAFEFDRSANQTRVKTLHVLVDALGVVEDVRFDSSAKPIPAPPAPSVITVPSYTPPRRR